MSRLLLTLLALLTGLTVSGGSANAQLCGPGDAQIGAVESAPGAEQLAAFAVATLQPSMHRPAVTGFRPCAAPQRRQVLVPTVMLGADRARE